MSDNGISAAKSTAGQLVQQSHGGALRRGSLPGNTPGTGRPPSAIRRAMRHAMADRVNILTDIADNPECSPADRMKAIDLLGKYGLGARFSMEVAAKMAKRDNTRIESDEADALP